MPTRADSQLLERQHQVAKADKKNTSGRVLKDAQVLAIDERCGYIYHNIYAYYMRGILHNMC